MVTKRWYGGACSALVLTACNLSALPQAATQSKLASTAPVATALGATGAASVSTASLPFKTVAFDDGGGGQYFAAGSSESVVLNSKADLDAFVARRKPAVAPVYGPPQPNASAGPPEPVPMLAPPGAPIPPQPTFQPQALPDTLTKLDFSKYEAIAFFDGQVKVASESRILAVQDQPDCWVVATKRWEPPANPDAIPDVNGRLHVIAIARSSKPVTFSPTVVDDKGSSGGGYGRGGNPLMDPQWTPVPNPDITQASIEAMLLGQQTPGNKVTVDVELKPLTEATLYFPIGSLVWVATVTGNDIQGGIGPGVGGLASPSVGGTPATVSQETLYISPEDGQIFESTASKTAPGTPGFSFNAQLGSPTYLGDTLTYKVSGPMQAGSLQLSIKKPDGTVIWNKAVAYSDLASFSLKLDPADVPGIQDVAVQDLELDETFGNGSEGHPFTLLKDRNAQNEPQEPISRGLYDGLDVNASVDKFANDIVTGAWQGKNLKVTSRDATAADLTLDPIRFVLTPDAKQHFYEFAGTFPDFYLPALSSGTGQETVMTPTVVRLVIAAESNNLVVLSDRGFAR